MKKLATVYRDSCRELKQVRTITTAAMFMAVSVVLGYFTIEAGPYLKIGFKSVINQFVYFLFGPVVGGFYQSSGFKPTCGLNLPEHFFRDSFNAILAGIIYGTFLYQRPPHSREPWRFTSSSSWSATYSPQHAVSQHVSSKGILALIPMRLVKNMIMWPIDTALFYLIAKKMEDAGIVKAIRKFRLPGARA